MRQPEVRAALVKGKPITPAEFWAARDDDDL